MERKVPKLRQGAVPSIFQHEKMPVYMSTTEPELRSTEAATSTARLQRENEQIEFSIEEHFRAESVTSLLELEEKLKPDRRYLPSATIHRRNATMTAIDDVILCVDEQPILTPPSVPRSFPAAAASIPNFSTTPRSLSVSTVALPKGRGSKPPKRVVGSIIVPVRVDRGSIGTLTRRTSPSSQRRMSSFDVVSRSFDSHLHSIITPTAINNDPNNNNVSSVGAPLKGLPMSSSASSNLQMF